VGIGKQFRDYVDTLVHARARSDGLTAARHRAFISARLFAGVVALAVFPLFIALRGVPSAIEAAIFAWFTTPILVAYILSRTGRYGLAQVISALSLTVCAVALSAAGGLESFGALWLVLIPLEAAVSASGRVLAFAAALALGAAGSLLLLDIHEMLPMITAPDHAAAILAVLAAALYAAGLAFGAQEFARTGAAMLQAEQDRCRIMGVASDAITRHDTHGAVVFASHMAEVTFGASTQELLGRGLYHRIHEADRPAYLMALADAAALRQTRTVEFRVLRDMPAAHGEHFAWVEMRCHPLEAIAPRAAGNGVIGVARDIGERKALRQTIEDARAELALANDTHRRLLATLGHELRTPLNALIGFSYLLANPQYAAHDEGRWHSYARLINESGTHLVSVLDSVLEAAKSATGEFSMAPKSFPPAPVIRNCCDLLSIEMRQAGLDLTLRLDDRLPKIVADERALRQILINLLVNAIKYTDRGGRITVTANTERGSLVVSVADTGIGIACDDISRLVEPSFRTPAARERQRDGAGLGLAIVKGLVAQHGGELKIASRLGEGTCVAIRLPLAGRTAAPADARSIVNSRQAVARAAGDRNDRVKKSA
jgi:cell cycle sensor histidine kinase DivJ